MKKENKYIYTQTRIGKKKKNQSSPLPLGAICPFVRDLRCGASQLDGGVAGTRREIRLAGWV